MDADALSIAVFEKVAALQAELLGKVQANLSGGTLHERSGTLKASILAETFATGAVTIAALATSGVPYAAIQEHGGTTAPHAIVPVKARALAFAGIVVRGAKHPGSVIPARPYLGGALDALRDDIAAGLKAAIRTALAAA